VTDAPGREQDQGRRHRRKGAPSPETASLLAEYQAAMRAELRATLVELRGKLPPPGLDLTGAPPVAERPSLNDRGKLWDLAIKLATQLGTEVDPAPARTAEGPRPRPRRAARIDYG
jgi:hypothetical protein